MRILYLHGWHSVPGGVKPSFLEKQGHEVINPVLDDDDFDAALFAAQTEFDRNPPEVIVGSSRGGAVAMNLESGETPLVLLCPAWKKYGSAKSTRRNSTILHSRDDNVIPFADSEELIRNSGSPAPALIEVGNDHRLADSETLARMLEKCLATRPRLVGCDFGVPKGAGDQARKIILVEAVRIGERRYVIETAGRNARLVHEFAPRSPWKARRRGWTLPDLADSLSADPSVKVAAFDFPFSLPVSLLSDTEFARLVDQSPFQTRDNWAKFVVANLRLTFDDDSPDAELLDLASFAKWRDKRFWLRRTTDIATNGSPPLKHKFQNVFAMTIAGTAMLGRLERQGYSTILDSADIPSSPCLIETYPRAVANRVGFAGGYKASPKDCLEKAVAFMKKQDVEIEFDRDVRHFCETYRTSGNDPDGADAFLCLITAIAYAEGVAELCDGGTSSEILKDEGAIVVPKR